MLSYLTHSCMLFLYVGTLYIILLCLMQDGFVCHPRWRTQAFQEKFTYITLNTEALRQKLVFLHKTKRYMFRTAFQTFIVCSLHSTRCLFAITMYCLHRHVKLIDRIKQTVQNHKSHTRVLPVSSHLKFIKMIRRLRLRPRPFWQHKGGVV